VQGARFFQVTLKGTDRHAGSTPFEARKDTLVAAAQAIVAFDALGRQHAPDLRITVGRIVSSPGSINTTPSRTVYTIDLRHPSSAMLDRMEQEARAIIAGAAQHTGTSCAIERVMSLAPVGFDGDVVATLRRAAAATGLKHRDMLSGAFHDACYISAVAPTAMLFIPCHDGISHAEEESATPADCAAGARVLLGGLLELAAR
jgi:N-carbamoyl-L-amino-acid hydrolase